MNIVVTGCAGFIGFHTSNFLINKKNNIFGIDNLNNYYDIGLKINRLKILKKNNNFTFIKNNLSNLNFLKNLVRKKKIKLIIHLAAQAGVRDSILYPKKYFENNVAVFFNILEACRYSKINLIYASSSSIYGEKKPMKESIETRPIQFYAATKKTNEIMADVYSNLYGFKSIGLRFFTVYGPFGRPDMSYFKFTKKLFKKKTINIYNNFNHSRDFTYISDVVDFIYKCKILLNKKNYNKPFNIFNVGRGKIVKLKTLVNIIQKNFKKKFIFKILGKQVGDVNDTLAIISKSKKEINFKPKVSFEKGMHGFCVWFKNYYNL